MAGFKTKTRRRLLQSLAVAGGLLVVAVTGSAMFGCAAVIREERYEFEHHFETAGLHAQPEWVILYISPTRRVENVVPGFYRRVVWGEPYVLRLTVGGQFETLTSMEFRIVADGIEVGGAATDLQRMNDGRLFSPVWNDHHFPTEDRTLDLRWDAVQKLEASIRFTARDGNGSERTHAQDITFVKAAYGETYTFARLVREDLQGLFIH